MSLCVSLAAPVAASSPSKVHVKVSIPSAVVTLVHALVSKHLTASPQPLCTTIDGTVNLSSLSDDSSPGQPAVADAGCDIPPVVRAHAFLALGKLCLRDGGLAKRVVHMLVRELRDVTSPLAVRSNVLIVLCDLCVRYTAIGTPTGGSMCVCMWMCR